MVKVKTDPHIGVTIGEDYEIQAFIKSGAIGSVYKAVRRPPFDDVVAIKVIKNENLKQGWERELSKVTKLHSVPNIVHYRFHGQSFDKSNEPFIWVAWEFIDGKDLTDYVKDSKTSPIDIAFIETFTKTVLEVLHACRAVSIEHGDLHEGNILISNRDSRFPDNPRRIYISDFGYGGSHNKLEPKNDYRQLFAIVARLLKSLDPSELNARDRISYSRLDEFIQKKVLELDPTQGRFAGNPKALLDEFKFLISNLDLINLEKVEENKRPDDYLVAEKLGNRADEWKSLFVPEFLAPDKLLSNNITVLTGARGCGKTMIFRRLTAFMDQLVGKPSGVKGADNFVGFYLNCRDLVEAFPWVPTRPREGMQQQIIHFFHLAWMEEVVNTLAISTSQDWEAYTGINDLLEKRFGLRYERLPYGSNHLAHANSFINELKEEARVAPLGRLKGLKKWPLARLDFLDELQVYLENNVPWIGKKPLFFFLDDYTTPTISPEVQRILNPIIFKRRSKLIFKISTESSNSFERTGLHGKPLELRHDFELIDLASECLHEPSVTKERFLDNVFRPRISRYKKFEKREFGLRNVLGNFDKSNNALAFLLRDKHEGINKQRIYYYGAETFVGVWSSDIRAMISLFTSMLQDADRGLSATSYQIPKKIQDKVFRIKGGEFLQNIDNSAIDPNPQTRHMDPSRAGTRFGTHLKNIAETFVSISKYELTSGPLVKNQKLSVPKQAFRLEIIDKFELPEEALRYYDGLVRWHVFLQDWRGKSVRGMITPRLYLNRILLPYGNLTFSSRDNIQLTNEEFTNLLLDPINFGDKWKSKRDGAARQLRLIE